MFFKNLFKYFKILLFVIFYIEQNLRVGMLLKFKSTIKLIFKPIDKLLFYYTLVFE